MARTKMNKRLLAILLSFAIAFAFMPGLAMAKGSDMNQKSKKIAVKEIKRNNAIRTHKKSIRKNDGSKYELIYEYGLSSYDANVDNVESSRYPENEDVMTVIIDDSEVEFTFDEDDFYDASGNKMTDYGFDWYYVWEDDYYNFEAGKTYYYSFFIVKTNENGAPVDEYGNEVEDALDGQVYAFSDLIAIHSVDYHFGSYNGKDLIYKEINGIIYAVYDGEKTACVLSTNGNLSGTVNISSNVIFANKTYSVTYIDESAFVGNQRMTSVIIPSTIKEIGKDAFCNTGIQEIRIPETVTSIGMHAFGFEKEQIGEYYYYNPYTNFVVDAKEGSAAANYAKNNGIKQVDRVAEAAKKAAAEKAAKEKAAAEKAAKEKAAAEKAAKIKKAKAAKAKIKVKALKKKKVQLTWKKVNGVNGFEIYQGAKKKGKFKKIATLKKAKAIKWKSKKLKKVKKGKKAFFKVRTYTIVDGAKVYGKWSNVAAVKIK